MYFNFQFIIIIVLILILLYIISKNEYFQFRRLNNRRCPFGRCTRRCPNYICDRFGCGCRFNYTQYLV